MSEWSEPRKEGETRKKLEEEPDYFSPFLPLYVVRDWLFPLLILNVSSDGMDEEQCVLVRGERREERE